MQSETRSNDKEFMLEEKFFLKKLNYLRNCLPFSVSFFALLNRWVNLTASGLTGLLFFPVRREVEIRAAPYSCREDFS